MDRHATPVLLCVCSAKDMVFIFSLFGLKFLKSLEFHFKKHAATLFSVNITVVEEGTYYSFMNILEHFHHNYEVLIQLCTTQTRST